MTADLERIGIPRNNMPELPEVETVKRLLEKIVIGRTITSIDVLNRRQIDGDVDEFVSTLTNQTILSLSRIGKYLIFHFTNQYVMISHLRMEGKYFEYEECETNSKYARIVFHFDNNHKLCYDDSRTFGILKLAKEDNYQDLEMIKKLGKEPFFTDPNDIYTKTRKNRTPIKTSLLDQTLMTGLGNIYVDETLYKSHVHPHTPAYLLSLEDYKNIVNNSCIVLNRAIELGGSTIKSYHPGKNIDGNFQNEIEIYGKKGETCPKCGHTFLFTKTNGRGTTYCPGCQHKLGAPLIIGLVGKISSGKSLALETFSSLGCYTISSDEIVHELYKQKEVVNRINKLFSLSFKDEINLKELREYITIHKEDKKKLERLIHPLVKKEIINRIKFNKNPLIVVEVPLLFKAHYEDLFDSIIVIDIPADLQLARLKERNPLSAEALLEINKDNMIEENKNKAEFLVLNDSSKSVFIKNIKNIFNIMKSRLG